MKTPAIWWRATLICASTRRDCRRLLAIVRHLARNTCTSFLGNRIIIRQGCSKCPRSAATKTNPSSSSSSLTIIDHICIRLGRLSTQNLTRCFPPPHFNTNSNSSRNRMISFCDNDHRVTCKVWNTSLRDHATTSRRAWVVQLSPSKAPASATPGMSPILAHTTTVGGSSQTAAYKHRLPRDFSPRTGRTVLYTRIFYLENKFNLITI